MKKNMNVKKDPYRLYKNNENKVGSVSNELFKTTVCAPQWLIPDIYIYI